MSLFDSIKDPSNEKRRNNNLGSNRSRFEIISEILTIAKENWIGITQILYGAQLSFRQVKRYIEFLLGKELLRASETDRKIRYKTSSRGIKFLKNYEKTLKWL